MPITSDYPPPEVLSQEEQRSHLSIAAFQIAEQWAYGVSPRLSVAERVHGAVHGVLGLLQQGDQSLGVPAFHLAPVFNEMEETVTEVMRGDGMVDAVWDHGVMMDLHGPEETPSVTDLYKGIYDSHRERFTIAARELFG